MKLLDKGRMAKILQNAENAKAEMLHKCTTKFKQKKYKNAYFKQNAAT